MDNDAYPCLCSRQPNKETVNEQKDGGRPRRHRGRAGHSGVLLPVEQQFVGPRERSGEQRRQLGVRSSPASGGAGASAIVGSSSFNDAALQALTTKIQGAIGSKSLSGVKIAMITNGNASYWNEAKAGWNAAMKWLGGKGATGEFTEPTSSTASVQVSLLETLTSQGYTGWGVSAVTVCLGHHADRAGGGEGRQRGRLRLAAARTPRPSSTSARRTPRLAATPARR